MNNQLLPMTKTQQRLLDEDGINAVWIYAFDSAIKSDGDALFMFCDYLTKAISDDLIPKRAKEYIAYDLKEFIEKHSQFILSPKNTLIFQKWQEVYDAIKNQT